MHRLTQLGVALAAGLVISALTVAAPAGATGSYPGETLSIAQSGPAVVGTAATFVATGQDLDAEGYAGGFNLDVFRKDPRVDSTCAPTYLGERDTWITEAGRGELPIVNGAWEGASTAPFSLPFKAVFDQPGPVLLCAYSEWGSDTAAAAELRFDVQASGGSPAAKPPANVSRPRLSRSGNRLACSTGTWTNAPTRFAYRWLVDGRARANAVASRLTVVPGLRGHRVRCAVTASNAAGRTTALSLPLEVH